MRGGGNMNIKNAFVRGLAMHGLDNVARSDPREAAKLMIDLMDGER